MNIYLHVEIVARELNSKLLLATLAASRGHHVVISNLNEIIKNAHQGIFPAGIFHTKSLSPNINKINRHDNLLKKGFLITSIDEEGGLIYNSYERMAKSRYSELTIDQTSAVFAWGLDDYETLKKFYPKNSSKFHMTGSPRADLWKPFFLDQSENISELMKKPYLLISPARPMLFANHMKPFHEIIRLAEDSGELNRDPKSFEQLFNDMSIGYRLTYNFIEAIRYLAKQNNGYDIVLRPHPVENIETWKVYLKNIPNVHVIRKGSITPWLHNAFALMHNNCTTALEASVSGKPVITYLPFPQYYDKQIPSRLGLKVETLEELAIQVNKIFNTIKLDKKKINEQISDIVLNKIYIDHNELAAEKMIKVWESLVSDENLQFSKPISFNWNLRIIKFRKIIKRIYDKSPHVIDKNNATHWKFPPLNKTYIIEYVNKLKQILNISEKLECKFITDRTVLIKKIKNY